MITVGVFHVPLELRVDDHGHGSIGRVIWSTDGLLLPSGSQSLSSQKGGRRFRGKALTKASSMAALLLLNARM